jgi:hypothetical protein
VVATWGSAMRAVNSEFWKARHRRPAALTTIAHPMLGTTIIIPVDADEQRAAELFVMLRDQIESRLLARNAR